MFISYLMWDIMRYVVEKEAYNPYCGLHVILVMCTFAKNHGTIALRLQTLFYIEV